MSNAPLANPPLVLTLAQVKFNAVPSMDTYYKKIQDEFRRQLTFIYHDVEETSTVNVGPQQVGIAKSTLWTSSAADYKTRLVLGNDSLLIETTEYPGFDQFVPDLKKSLHIVQNVTGITHITRLGFRYINRIEATPQKPLEYFLDSQLLGFQFQNIKDNKAVSRTEAIGNSKDGVLRLHCMQFVREKDVTRNPLLPPDIRTRLEVKPVITPKLSKYAFLDIDHFRDFGKGPIKCDIKDVFIRLDRLHQGGYDTFVSGVTKDAMQEWG